MERKGISIEEEYKEGLRLMMYLIIRNRGSKSL